MFNKIWWTFHHTKAVVKAALRFKLSSWEEFVIKIGLD